MTHRKQNKTVLAILIVFILIGLILRIDFLISKLQDFNFVGDARNYLIMSQQLVDDGIYGYALAHKSGHPNAYVTPGYPLILSAAYALIRNPYLQVTAVRILQVIAGGILSPLFAFLFVRRLFKRDGLALFTALFTAIYPTYVISSTYILTEVFSLTAMLLYFYLQTVSLQDKKACPCVLAGLAFGVNVLIRPTMFPLLLLPFLFAFASWKKAERLVLLKAFAYTASGVIALMLPWWVRNFITMHRFIPLSTGSGDPLLAGTYPYMTGLFQDYLSEKVRVSETAYAQKRILEGFTSQPVLYFKWYTIGKLRSLFEKPWLYTQVIPASFIGLLVAKSHYFLHYFLIRMGILGTAIGVIKKDAILYIGIYGACFLGLLMIFIPENRYAYHILFFLMLSASYAVCYIANALKIVWKKWLLRIRRPKQINPA
jgi:4-amino-4-deoxy-L-arabinose transferase-like glycosyltransferase